MNASLVRDFEVFWPKGLPFPPQYPWVAARWTRKRLGRKLDAVVTSGLETAGFTTEADVVESASTRAVLLGLALGTLFVIAYIALSLDDDESAEKEDGGSDEEEATEEAEDEEAADAGLWDPDGAGAGSGKPVWQ